MIYDGVIKYEFVMTVRTTDMLLAIQKLNHAEKHSLWEYLIGSLTATTLTGTVLDENSERKKKDGYRCPDCKSKHIGLETTLQ